MVDEAGREAAMCTSPSRRVFVIHGHDEPRLSQVQDLLRQSGFDPVVLREQPNYGATLVEKLEALAADVCYAVALMTGDDEGGVRPDRAMGRKHQMGKAKKPRTFELRVRQNVMFEVGYFFGRINRTHVCLLVDPGVKIPSDLEGVGRIKLEAGWEERLKVEILTAVPVVFPRVNG